MKKDKSEWTEKGMDSIMDYLIEEAYYEEDETSEGMITENDLKSFFSCAYSLLIKRFIGPSKIPRTASSAEALFFQQARKALYDIRNVESGRPFPWEYRTGYGMKSVREMNSEELSAFLAASSARAFGGSLEGKWIAMTKGGKFHGEVIAYSSKSQNHFISEELKEAGTNYYDFAVENPGIIIGYINKIISFEFKGHTFKIKLPELRHGQMTIDDPTIWSFNTDFAYDDSKHNIETSSLVTMRILGFCILASQFPAYQRIWGLKEEDVERWGGNEVWIDERVNYRHFNATAQTMNNRNLGKEKGTFFDEVSVTHRSDKHLDPFMRNIEYFLEETGKERYPVNHSHCPTCTFNVADLSGHHVCRLVRKGVKPALAEEFYRMSTFDIHERREDNRIILDAVMSKKEGIEKKVAMYELSLDKKVDGIVVSSNYYSALRNIRPDKEGSSYEERMLKYADNLLQNIADREGIPIVHHLGFARNFHRTGEGEYTYAGYTKLMDLALKLGYMNDKKTYLPQKQASK